MLINTTSKEVEGLFCTCLQIPVEGQVQGPVPPGEKVRGEPPLPYTSLPGAYNQARAFNQASAMVSSL